MRRLLFFLALTASAQDLAPGGDEQDRILLAMQRYAAQYVSNLPNFLCNQITRQLDAGTKSKHWHKGDTLLAKLSFNQGEEHRTLDSVNGKPVKPGSSHLRTPLVTEGEFGILLSRVLGPESEAVFTWHGWDTLRGQRLVVFDYAVDKAHSTLTLGLGDLAKAVIPYSGTLYADPATGAVWRITDDATEIPAALQTREISTVVDYAETDIGGVQYLLPIEASVALQLEGKRVRNEIEFHDYRKFAADSVITFGPPDSPPAAPND